MLILNALLPPQVDIENTNPDRMVHTFYRIELKGESLRKKSKIVRPSTSLSQNHTGVNIQEHWSTSASSGISKFTREIGEVENPYARERGTKVFILSDPLININSIYRKKRIKALNYQALNL